MGKRVAILDSGVNRAHPHVRGQGEVVVGPTIGAVHTDDDLLGHGTAVAAAILDLAPGSVIYSVRVFAERFACPFEHVLEGLRAALEWQPDLINLSLGTTSPEYCAALEQLVNSTSARIVAPASDRGMSSYPGCLDGVDSVVIDPNRPRAMPELRAVSGRKFWFASPHPRAIDDVPRASNWSGVSFAVANVTGFLAAGATRARAAPP